MQIDASEWIQVIMALTVPLTVLVVVWARTKTGKGLGVKALRFVALGTVIPAAVILGLREILSPDAVASIFGAVVGYLFSSMSLEEAKEKETGG